MHLADRIDPLRVDGGCDADPEYLHRIGHRTDLPDPQFFDRDALPAMANNVMIPALQSFIKDGNVDVKNLEAQAKSLYAAQ